MENVVFSNKGGKRTRMFFFEFNKRTHTYYNRASQNHRQCV